jgi:cellulose synthase operon protein C
MMLKQIFIIFHFLLFLTCGYLYAQPRSTTEIKFKLGQSYEQSGDLEQAVKLYGEAFSKDSSNNVIYDALKRVQIKLKMYPEVILLMEYWLKNHQNDISTIAQLGSAYVSASNEKKGMDIWEKAIEKNKKNENFYRIISGAATQSRLFDYAITLLRRGRNAIGNPIIFTNDIARLYAVVLNYGSATREYLDLLKADPGQLGYVQMSIGTFTERADGLLASTQAVEEAVKSDSDNIQYLQLLTWLYMEGNKYDLAYDVYKFLDNKLNAKGLELFSFSERAAREKSYDIAKKSIEELIKTYPNASYISQAKFRLGAILEESADTVGLLPVFGSENPFSDTSNRSARYHPSLDVYKQIVAQYPGTELAAHSLLRIAYIQKEKSSSVENAGITLETIIKDYGKFIPIVIDARLILGDVYTIQNDLARAADECNTILNTKGVSPVIRDAASLRLAKNDYYNLNFQSAIDKLTILTSNSSSDAANDALSLKLFISEAKSQSEDGLKEFVRAELFRVQKRDSESFQLLKTIAKKFTAPAIQEQALMSMGDIQSTRHNYTEALGAFDSLIIRFPESILVEQAILKVGLLQECGVKNKILAIDAYQNLLLKFPNSIYSNEARRRIRELRGDNI